MGQHIDECGNLDITRGHKGRSELTIVPVPRLLDPNVCTIFSFFLGLPLNPVFRFLPADALWNLAMAINVYLTLFRKYNASQLKSLEWIYMLVCYGGTFVPAFVYCFVETAGRGKIYGSATLWCWVSIKWDFLRVALCYGPAW